MIVSRLLLLFGDSLSIDADLHFINVNKYFALFDLEQIKMNLSVSKANAPAYFNCLVFYFHSKI